LGIGAAYYLFCLPLAILIILLGMIENIRLKTEVENLGSEILDAAIFVHRELGPGLLEGAYQACLKSELQVRKLRCQAEVPIPIRFNNEVVESVFRADLIVENQVLLELKSVESLAPVHLAQTITYLKLTGLDLGYLLNFNVTLLKTGITRVIHPKFFSSRPVSASLQRA
jgi:GxxExxY protein